MRARLKRLWLIGAALLLAAAAPSPEGRWLTPDGDGIIEITACGPGLCGQLVGLFDAGRANGTPATDPHGIPMCRRIILHAVPTSDGRWGGTITDPATGHVWSCNLWLDADGNLHLHGYVLTELFGASQIWHPTAQVPAMDCTMPTE